MQQTVSRFATAPEEIVHIAHHDVEQAEPGLGPAGIVFHVGRCGSTAISQALARSGKAVVYSEPLPVNEILASEHATRQVRIGALRRLGDALAAHAAKPYVLKLTSWNTLFCDLVADAFPQSPWVFSVRDPVEVGAAILARPPPWFRGSTDAAQYISRTVDGRSESSSPEEFFARLYAECCNAIMRLDRSRGTVVCYELLHDALTDIVPPHFHLALDEAARARVRASAELYAKAPPSRPQKFASDSDAKQAAATSELRHAVKTIASDPLNQLLQRFGASVDR